MLPNINEQHADFVLSLVKNGLSDIVSQTKLNKDKTNIEFDLQPDLIEKFVLKFPKADLIELDHAVEWIIYKSLFYHKD
jgi:riboflavin synthase alpha subunit